MAHRRHWKIFLVVIRFLHGIVYKDAKFMVDCQKFRILKIQDGGRICIAGGTICLDDRPTGVHLFQ